MARAMSAESEIPASKAAWWTAAASGSSRSTVFFTVMPTILPEQ